MSTKSQKWKRVTIKFIQQFDAPHLQDRFSCQCGKIYLNFPALYLHFKRVHNKKISTRVEDELCLVQRSQGERNFLYFYSKDGRPEDQPTEPPQPHSHLHSLLLDFTAQIEESWVKLVSARLCSYLYGWLLHTCGDSVAESMHSIGGQVPKRLGQFLEEYQAVLAYEGILEQAYYLVGELGKWLALKSTGQVKVESIESEVKEEAKE